MSDQLKTRAWNAFLGTPQTRKEIDKAVYSAGRKRYPDGWHVRVFPTEVSVWKGLVKHKAFKKREYGSDMKRLAMDYMADQDRNERLMDFFLYGRAA